MERKVGLVRGTRWLMGSSASRAVQEEQVEVIDMGRCKVAVRGQSLQAGFGGLPTKPSEDGFLVWASKPRPKAQRDGDGDLGASGSFEVGGHVA